MAAGCCVRQVKYTSGRSGGTNLGKCTEFSWLLANPIFACKDALHNRDDGAPFIRSHGK